MGTLRENLNDPQKRAAIIEDGVRMANDSIYGLAARVYTRDLKTAILAASELRAGTVSVNQYMLNYVQTPYGGFK